MRTYTLIFSIVVHVSACVTLFATVLATHELPVPREDTTFVNVAMSPPPDPPPPARIRVADAAPATVPLQAPVGVRAEVEQPLPPDIADVAATGGVPGVGAEPAIVVVDAPPPPLQAPLPVRVGGGVQAPVRTRHVAPVYPAIARSAGVAGVVMLEATIDEHGGVENVRVLRSVALLDAAAVDAVRQWRFTPTLLNGQPVPVLMTITVSFTLN